MSSKVFAACASASAIQTANEPVSSFKSMLNLGREDRGEVHTHPAQTWGRLECSGCVFETMVIGALFRDERTWFVARLNSLYMLWAQTEIEGGSIVCSSFRALRVTNVYWAVHWFLPHQ